MAAAPEDHVYVGLDIEEGEEAVDLDEGLATCTGNGGGCLDWNTFQAFQTLGVGPACRGRWGIIQKGGGKRSSLGKKGGNSDS